MKAKKNTAATPFLPLPVQGLFILSLALMILFSFLSFTDENPKGNWLGLFGHSLGWGLHYLMGLSALLIPIYFGWWGFSLLKRKPLSHPRLKVCCLGILIFSSAILLAMLSQAQPHFSAHFKRVVYSEFYSKGTPFEPTPMRYYLGGVPMHRLYVDLAHVNFSRLFGSVGTFLIFFTLSITSTILLTDFSFIYPFSFLKRGLRKLMTSWKTSSTREISLGKKGAKMRDRPFANQVEEESPEPSLARKHPLKNVKFPSQLKITESREKIREGKMLSPPKVKSGAGAQYVLPPTSLLTEVKPIDKSSLKDDLRRQAEVLEETLLSFGIEAKVGDIHCGPTITSFEVHPAIGVKVQKIKALENDIALNMQAKSIRIIAPIPGKAAVGIEVPNPRPQEVGFRELLENYHDGHKKGHIPLLLGKVVNGDDIWTDLTKMPHLIIAGATGSGKSVCINTIVMSILTTARPDEIKVVMIDPKKVELTGYSRLPHMLAPVITEPGEACAALGWLVKEMERRYEIFRQLGIRNIHGFNERKINQELEASLDFEIPEKMPFIVVIIDELADLMMVSSSDIETPIARIAQMARAVGIHLILATQRPSREVITGLIKANFPTRIAFKVANRVNSQIIIDENGGECLLGNGDMLFMPPGTSSLVRAQGAFIRDEDIKRVIDYICGQAETHYLIPSFHAYQTHLEEKAQSDGNDPLFQEAKKLVLETGNASTTFLQRKLKVGYARAASLMDELEAHHIIGPQEGAKPRKIFYPSQSGE